LSCTFWHRSKRSVQWHVAIWSTGSGSCSSGGYESGLYDKLPRYGPDFKRPSKKELRLAKARKGPRMLAKTARAAIKAAKNGQYLVSGKLGISISRSGHQKKTVEKWERLGLIEPAARVGPRLKIHDENALRAAKRARSANFDGV